MRLEIDHHSASLRTGHFHVLYPEPASARHRAGRSLVPLRVIKYRPDDIRTRPASVVEHVPRHTIAVCIEYLTDMRQTVPLR